jgi:hypothetical protein
LQAWSGASVSDFFALLLLLLLLLERRLGGNEHKLA